MITEMEVEPKQRREVFSSVPDDLALYERLEQIPPGTSLFHEGDAPLGVYYLHAGEVDLRMAARDGERSLLTARPGQLLGLTCVVSGRAHDCSATTRTTCITGFIDKKTFLRLLDEKPSLWLSVLQMISANVNQCWECMRALNTR